MLVNVLLIVVGLAALVLLWATRKSPARQRRRILVASGLVLALIAFLSVTTGGGLRPLTRSELVALLLIVLGAVLAGILVGSWLAFRRARDSENRGMVVSGVLFVSLGAFGLTAGISYFLFSGGSPEFAGVQLLCTFFVADIFIGLILLSNSSAAQRFRDEPDTGLPGSADPELGAADEHGNIHLMAPTMAPFAYSLAAIVLLAGVVYRDKLWGPWGIAFGLTAAVVATVIWYRDVSIDAHAALEGAGHGGGGHAAVATIEAPAGPPTAANYFEQVRQALEAGDADWAADAYAAGAVYYEPANPPHEGRESIRAYLNDFGKGHKGLTWDVERMGVDGDVAIVQWSLSFTARDGRTVSGQTGVTVIQAGEAGITYHRDYL